MWRASLQHEDAPPLSALVWRSLPAALAEAAAPLCVALECSLIGRRCGTGALAAFGAANATASFATGLCNFALMVSMASVASAVGSEEFALARKRVCFTYTSSLLLGAAMGAALYGMRDLVLTHLMQLSPDVRTLAEVYYPLRMAAIPFEIVGRKAAMGCLGGYQWLYAYTMLSVCSSLCEGGAAVYILEYGGGVAGVDQVIDPGVYDRSSNIDALRKFGLALVVVCAGTAAVGATLTAVAAVVSGAEAEAPPRTSHAHLRTKSGDPDGQMLTAHGADTSDHMLAFDSGLNAPPPDSFSACAFVAASANTILRSAALQASVYALSVAAARISTHALAAHQVLLLLWMITSFVVDGAADVGTALGAKYFGGGQTRAFMQLSRRIVTIAVSVGAVAALVLLVFAHQIQHLFSHDAALLQQLRSCWALLVVMQVPNAGVFALDGLMLGAQAFRVIRNLMCSGCLVVFAGALAVAMAQPDPTLLGVWLAKCALNLWRLTGSAIFVFARGAGAGRRDFTIVAPDGGELSEPLWR